MRPLLFLQLHLTLKNAQDAISGRQDLALSQAIEDHGSAPKTLQALRDALIASGAADATAPKPVPPAVLSTVPAAFSEPVV
jgi:hypothetical protein